MPVEVAPAIAATSTTMEITVSKFELLRELTATQKAMVQSFDRYVCVVQPDKGDAAGQKQLVEVKYARCRLYYEAHHWSEAAACSRGPLSPSRASRPRPA